MRNGAWCSTWGNCPSSCSCRCARDLDAAAPAEVGPRPLGPPRTRVAGAGRYRVRGNRLWSIVAASGQGRRAGNGAATGGGCVRCGRLSAVLVLAFDVVLLISASLSGLAMATSPRRRSSTDNDLAALSSTVRVTSRGLEPISGRDRRGSTRPRSPRFRSHPPSPRGCSRADRVGVGWGASGR